MEAFQAEIHRMLGGRTPAEFSRLLPEERKRVFRQHLVNDNPVIIEEGDDGDEMNPQIALGRLLQQEYFMGSDTTGKQLVKEARELFYGENDFVVRLHWLCEFLIDRLGDYTTGIAIAPLVRSITVIVDLHDSWNEHHIYGSDSEEDENGVHHRNGNGKLTRWTRKKLKDLLAFTGANQITVVLSGRGVLDGSDLATHQTIRDIASVVKELIAVFGDRFTIMKRLDRGYTRQCSLRSYWDAPTTQTRQMVRNGEATFEQLMQVEIEEWTRKIPRTAGQLMHREILA